MAKRLGCRCSSMMRLASVLQLGLFIAVTIGPESATVWGFSIRSSTTTTQKRLVSNLQGPAAAPATIRSTCSPNRRARQPRSFHLFSSAKNDDDDVSSSSPSTAAAQPQQSSQQQEHQVLVQPPPPPKPIRQQNFTVTFPPLLELASIRRGDFVASDIITVKCDTCISSPADEANDNNKNEEEQHQFRVLLYPRGGGHSSSYTAMNNNNNKVEGGFGMGYQMVPLFQQRLQQDAANDRLGVYLKYLPQSPDDTVDATFTLRLKGRQNEASTDGGTTGSGPPRRFDVEWATGMRFVAADRGNLRDGTANDFGAHMMQSSLLEPFLGGDDANNELQVEVSIQIHSSSSASSSQATAVAEDTNNSRPDGGKKTGFLSFDDIRQTDESRGVHNPETVRVGKIVVPILQRLSQRPRLFQLGAYPGVEYRIMRILHPTTGEDIFTSLPGADYDLKPLYPLVPSLERQWPVRVNEQELPKLYTMTMYNAASAIGSLVTAVTALTVAFVVSQLVSLFFIPSKSMDPTLRVGDVLVVEKVTPRLFNNNNNVVGSVILFHPNDKLQQIVQSSGGRVSDRDLFVKRVAAGPGDFVSVDATGTVSINGIPAPGARDSCDEEPLKLIRRYVQPINHQEIGNNQVFVLGDCSSVSVDSRVWGPLDTTDIVGRPLLRIWPLDDRWGTVPGLLPQQRPATEEGEVVVLKDTQSLVTEWNNELL